MNWWLRILVTLVLAPILSQLASIYLGSTQGGAPEALLTAALVALPKVYLVYTLPALALVALFLLPADRLLARVGADLLIVGVAPLLAMLVPLLLSLVSSDPRLDAAGLVYLAFAYGLVFGLTIREPRTGQARTANEGPRA